ncbi:MAG: FAD-dependent oxidoreductase [Phycisphaeraceae bacterium]|nr:FAD-dependent oxidoreductase [Phycisphaeraceae bacterium]
MRRAGISLRLGEKVASIQRLSEPMPSSDEASKSTPSEASEVSETSGAGDSPAWKCGAGSVPSGGTSSGGGGVEAVLESGKRLRAQTLLYAVGREGNARELALENVGLAADERGRLKVNEHFQTAAPHIYAVGDVIGFPALASTAMEQGRQASCHACGADTGGMTELLPYGIYAVPEISMIGKTEQQLTAEGIPFESGTALYQEIARGQLLGDHEGLLKLLVHQETRKILGVHIIGTGATELIHIGQAVMSFGGDVRFFVENVFNFPTLAECYRVAAFNALNRMRQAA